MSRQIVKVLKMKPEKALEMTLDAHALDSDDAAAAKHGVSDRTVRRAKQQVAQDPALTEHVQDKKRRMAEELHDSRVEVIRMMLDGMKSRLTSMEDRDFVGAYKIVTDHHEVALRVMNDGRGSQAQRESVSDSAEASEGLGAAQPKRWPTVHYEPPARHRTQ